MDPAIVCRSRKYRLVGAGGACAIGLAMAISYGTLLLDLLNCSRGFQIAWIGYLTVLFGGVSYWALRRVVLPNLAGSSRGGKVLWALGSLLMGLLLLVVVPVEVPLRRPIVDLEVVATGQRNAASQGAEVWVRAMRKADNTLIPFSELRLGESWEIRDEMPVSYRQQPGSLYWTGRLLDGLTVYFTAHTWSGIVVVRWNGVEQRIDLYDTKNGVREAYLAVPEALKRVRPSMAWALCSSYVVALAALSLMLGVHLARRPVGLNKSTQ